MPSQSEVASAARSDKSPPGVPTAPHRRVLVVSTAWLVSAWVAVGVLGVAAAGGPSLLNDGDTFTHIAVGRWIAQHRTLPFADPFSLTARGRDWVPHEWLAELVFARLYAGFGWGGVVLLTGIAAAAALALLAQNLARTLGPFAAVAGALAAFSLTAAHFLARPHVIAWPLLVVWMAAVVGARDRGRVPSLALLPVMTLWCNLHGGFVVGLLFVGLLASEAVFAAPASARWRTAARWGRFFGLAGVAALMSPNGIGALLLPLRMLRMPFALGSIGEWRPVNFARFDPLEAWIALAILAGLCFGIRLPLSRVLMVLLLLWLALTHVRNEELVGLIGPLVVAAPLAVQLGLPASASKPILRCVGRRRTLGFAAVAAPVVCGFLAMIAVFASGRSGPSGELAPVAAVEAARRSGLDGAVFNSGRFGGYLMLNGIPTFVDGRADLFGDAFLRRYVAAVNAIGGALPALLDRYGVAWTLLEPSAPAASVLDHLPGWERVYADGYAVVHRHIRTEAPAGCKFCMPQANGLR
jgi:hypothetical protein